MTFRCVASAGRLGPKVSDAEFQVLLPAAATGMRQDSKAQAEQVRSVAVERLGEPTGLVPGAIMLQIDEALRLHLAL